MITLNELSDKYYFLKGVCFEHMGGWADILDEFYSQLICLFKLAGSDYGFKIDQQKEKYGVLTIYYSFLDDNVPDELLKLVDAL